MKIAVSASGENLHSEVDPRFGRCACFLIVETEDLSFQVLGNGGPSMGHGAGIQSAQQVIESGARAVLTGNCGPNAVRTLSAAGVDVFVGHGGTVLEAVERYQSGGLVSTRQPNVEAHHGMAGQGRKGSGMGRRAAGADFGRGMKPESRGASPSGLSRDEEILQLKEEAMSLSDRMEKIRQKIEVLEKKQT